MLIQTSKDILLYLYYIIILETALCQEKRKSTFAIKNNTKQKNNKK